jgi:hypothetical protein
VNFLIFRKDLQGIYSEDLKMSSLEKKKKKVLETHTALPVLSFRTTQSISGKYVKHGNTAPASKKTE